MQRDLSVRQAAAELFTRRAGYKRVATVLGLSEKTAEKWQYTCRALGKGALSVTARKKYSHELKVAAARDVVEAGMTRPGVMAKYGIASLTPLENWCRAYREGGPDALLPKPKGRPAHIRQDRAAAHARGGPSLQDQEEGVQLLQGRVGQGRVQRPGQGLPRRRADAEARHGRHRVQPALGQGVPVACDGPLQQRDSRLGGVGAPEHGADRRDDGDAGAQARRPGAAALRPGLQYQQGSFQLKLAELGIVQSMPRKATCLDNACMEGFFGHMKDEFYRGRRFDSFESFKSGLDEYIEYWNTRRYQPRLKGMAPVQYRSHPIRAV